MSKKFDSDGGECIYEGEWVDNVRSGQGRLIWISDGRQYCGEWSDDAFHGSGVFSFSTGHVFHGTFNNHCPLKGFLYDPSGSIFSVSYKGNAICWEGRLPTAELINEITDEQQKSKAIEEIYDAFVLSKNYRQTNGDAAAAGGRHPGERRNSFPEPPKHVPFRAEFSVIVSTFINANLLLHFTRCCSHLRCYDSVYYILKTWRRKGDKIFEIPLAC